MGTPRRDARYDRRRQAFVHRMAAARTPQQQLAAATSYLLAAAKDAPPDAAASALRAVVDVAITQANGLAEMKPQRRGAGAASHAPLSRAPACDGASAQDRPSSTAVRFPGAVSGADR